MLELGKCKLGVNPMQGIKSRHDLPIQSPHCPKGQYRGSANCAVLHRLILHSVD
jgi:hypothetical protein